MKVTTVTAVSIAMGALLVADLGWAADPQKPTAARVTPSPSLGPNVAVTVFPSTIVKANVRAAATLYAASNFDEMKLFDAVERIVDDVRSGRLRLASKASRALVDAYADRRLDRVTKTNRQELTRFAREIVQGVFEGIVTDSAKQMEAYAALVRDVAASIDRFRNDQTTENRDRDSLADRYPDSTFKPATELARSLSQHGYGAAQLTASKLADQIREARAVLADPAITSAYGAKGQWDLVEKLGGPSADEADRLAQRAEAGALLLESLSDATDLLDAPVKDRAELARRLAAAASSARMWLAVKPPPLPKVPPKLVRPLCFDDKRTLVPCTVTKR